MVVVLERKLLHDLMVVGVGGQLFLVALQAEYYQWETGTEEPAVGRIEAVH